MRGNVLKAAIKAIEYHLPTQVLTNKQLVEEFPDWTVEKITQKTGIVERHIAAEEECSSDLGVAAAQKLFSSGVCQPENIDCLLLCTQTPDYFLPTTACLMQARLGIPTNSGALDFNLGCSGFVYGLGIAKGLIETEQANNVLLITAETYSKLIHPADRSVRTIFGDAAAATLLHSVNADDVGSYIGPFIFGTDGSGANNLIAPTGGMRHRYLRADEQTVIDERSSWRTSTDMYMNGSEVFSFTLRVVPKSVSELLIKSGKSLDEIDLFIFHQANRYMLEHLRKKLNIPKEKFYIAIAHSGNTVSATIPIALKHALKEGKLSAGNLVMLVGFGVGYSWGATLVQWIE